MKVVNTTDWPWEKFQPYAKAVTAAMRKLEERFPDDFDADYSAREIMAERRVLWLVLDDEDRFLSFFVIRVGELPATGVKVATVIDMAGDIGLEAVSEIVRVCEPWAKEQGADLFRIEGRRGWAREVVKHGYREHMVMFQKVVS